MDITSFIVRSSSGAIDHEASIGAFANALLKIESEREAQEEKIGMAVNALFDQYKGARLNIPFILTSVVPKLGSTPETHKTLEKATHRYIQARSQGATLEDGTVENPNSMFVIGKGKRGGVLRRADKR